ncbi:hypothetical protein YC2023_066212 [Brassica napus]
MFVGVCQQTQDVCGCPSAHTGRPWLFVCVRVCLWASVSTHRTCVGVRQHTQDVCGCPFVSVSTHRTSVAVHQYTYQNVGPWTQNADPSRVMFGTSVAVRVYLCVSDSTHRTSVAVHVCLSADTGRPWLSIRTHISMLSVQYTHDVRGCQSANIGRLWVSVITHMTSVGVYQHTQDVRGCLCVFVCVRQHTQDVRGCPSVHISARCTHRTSVGVRQHTQDVRGSPYVYVCVLVCPSAQTGRLWLSISTQISTLVLGLSTLALLVDCSGDFGPRGLSVQYTEDVRGCRTSVGVRVCPTEHTDVRSCPCVSVTTHKTSVAFHQHTYQHAGRPWVSVSTYRMSVAVCVCPCVFVGVRQHTQDVCGCQSENTGCQWLSTSTHISTLVLGLRTLALPVDCSGDFGPRGLSVQYTEDVRWCPSANIGRPWVSVSTYRMSVAVRVCPCVFVGVRQHTQDVCGCQSANTGCQWLSTSTHISTLVLGLRTLALPVDCSGDFGPRGLSVQYTEDVRGCPSAHTGHPWVSVSTHRTSVGVLRQHTQDVRSCPCVSVTTHRTSVAVHQYTYQHSGPWTQHAGPYRGQFGTSVGVRQHTQDVRRCPSAHTGHPWVTVSTHRTSVGVRQHTLDVRGCPSAQTGHPTHRMFVGVCQQTQDVRGCPSAHTGRPWLFVCVRVCLWASVSTHRTCVGVRQHTQDVCGCLCVSVSTHRTFVAVHQYTYQNVGPWTQNADPFRVMFGSFWPTWAGCSVHTGRPWVSVSTHRTSVAVRVYLCVSDSPHRTSVAVHVCLSAHTGRPWLSISTHISTLVLGHINAGPSRGLFGTSVGVRRHTERMWVSISTQRTSVAVCVCSCVSVSTHRTSVAVHHTHRTSVGVRQHTQDVCGSLYVYVCVLVCPSAQTGRPWLSISTHISTLVLGLSTLALLVDCLGDFGPRGLSVQYTEDVRGCPTHRTSVGVRVCPTEHTDVRSCPCVSVTTHRTSVAVHQYTYQHAVHIGCPLVSISKHRTSVGVRQHIQDVRSCPYVSVTTHRTSVAVHQYTYQHAGPWTQHAGPYRGLFGTDRTSVAVHVCPCVSDSTHRTPVAVRVCPSPHTGHPWLSIRTHISMLVLTVDCSGDFGPRGLSVQYTQDVRGTHRTSVAVHQYTYQNVGPWTQNADPSRVMFGLFWPTWAVCSVHTGRPWVSASTHRTSVAVRVCPSAHTGRPRLSISQHIRTLVLGLSTLTLPVECLGDFGPSGLFVQYTRDFCGCPPAHTGCPWLSVCVFQHVQDVCGCPSVHISARWSLDSACWPLPWPVRVILAHVGCLLSTHLTSVGVRQHFDLGPRGLSVQYTQGVCGCPAHTGCPWVSVSTHRMSVAVRVCPSAHTGHPWLSISTHISTLVLGLSTLTHPVDCSGDFGPRGLSVQYTQDVSGCPPAHTGHLWLSVCVRVCPCVFVCVRQHTGRPWLSISTHISTLVHGFSTLALPVDCSGDFGPRGLSVQYTQDIRGCTTHISTLVRGLSTLALTVDSSGNFGPRGMSVQYTLDVRGCPLPHTGRPWVSISTHWTSVGVRQHTHDIRGCPSAQTGRPWGSVSTHRTSVAVRVCQCVSDITHRTSVAVRVCPSPHTGRLWLSISTHISTLVLGLSNAGPSRGLFGTHMTSVGVRVCLWVSVSTHRMSVAVRVCPCMSVSTHRTSVAFDQYTYQNDGSWTQHADPSRGMFGMSVAVHQLTYQHGGPWTQHAGLSRGLFGTSVGVRQHTQDVRGCPSVAVRVCTCVSVTTHRTSVAVHQYTYQHVGPWTQHADPSRGLFGLAVGVRQHTQDVCGCTCVSVRTHRTSVAVHQYTYQNVGPWTQHADPSHGKFGTFVAVRVCSCVSVCVCVCPLAHTGRPWLSISTHISTLVLGFSTLALPVDCSGDFGPRGLSVQYTQDVRGCSSAHTGRLCVSVSTHMTSVAVRVCLSAHTGRQWLSISTHISTLVLGPSTLTLLVDCLGDFGPCGLSVQYTQDVRGCPPAHTGRPWLSVCVRVCLSADIGRPWLSISTHVSTLVLGLSTLTDIPWI